MRTSKISLVTSALALLAPTAAWAQADTEPPLPNVMLLIDSSGSMEYMMGLDKTTKKPVLPKCSTNGDPNAVNEQNRWTTLAAVLTGEFPQFACVAESRSTAAFTNEFSINGQVPYDKDYYLPYNRIVSVNTAANERCTMGPDTTKWPGANLFAFPDDAIKTHAIGNAGLTCTKIDGAFKLSQADDGLLDVFREKARFGLMTFDSLPDPKTGYASNAVDAAAGFAGHWSYFNGWDTGGTNYAKGKPELCTNNQDIEVGARNPAAPPWEGRMIGFGDPAAKLPTLAARNEQIQRAILAVRPYGATPLAGMVADAEFFFRGDNSTDKTDLALPTPLGPRNDPFIAGGCRKQFIILLTDGVPNLDLREGCKNNAPGPPNGTCPYSTPADTAKRLSAPANPNDKVRTFVVGFAFSSAETSGPVPLDCKTLTGVNDAACVNPSTDAVKACCEMAKIAYNGDTSVPRFADNKQELRKALNDILSEVAQSTTSRTTPVFASAGSASGGYSGGSNKVAAYNILSSFKVSTGGLWNGVLERQRYVCEKPAGVYTVVPKDISDIAGDSFSKNLESGLGSDRRFFTVVPSAVADRDKARYSLRGPGAIADGLGALSSLQVTDLRSNFASTNLTASMVLSKPGAQLSVCGTLKDPVSVDDCRNRLLRWYIGQAPINNALYDRVKTPLGSIYHSTPVVVGPPSEFVRDESYSAFANTYKERTPVVYTATTDGQLHAFKLGPESATDTDKVDSKLNNELWSFIPPGVLPDIQTIYPGVERRLLDIPLVARDVVYERARADAVTGAGGFNDWRTVLLTGMGPSTHSALHGGFFMLNVTTPAFEPPKVDKQGPKWLWQITADAAGQPLFGTSATPAITTLYLKTGTMTEAREVAVALLPGGSSTPTVGDCARADSTGQTVDGKWKFRPKTRCYADDDVARSLTIVRVDTGEVIRRFHRCKSNGQPPRPYDANLLSRSTCVPFDSPITGTPLPFPNNTGQSATRIFAGDQDGAMWRIDMSNIDPSKWTVSPFFDAFSPYTNNAQIGQPILAQPVASLDPVGNLVLIFSTGEQDRFDGTAGMRNVLWSVSETTDIPNAKVGSVANWHLGINTNENIQATPPGSGDGNWTNGIRVAGPLSLFGGAVYFTTYRPPAPGANACDPGSSVLWGVDYLKNISGDPQGDSAPKTALLDNNVLYHAKGYSNALIFGVGIQKLPSCYDTSSVSDPYLGFSGSSTSISDMSKPEYKLVVQTGAKGVSNNNAETKFETLNLQPPPSSARFSSWASVIE